MSAPAKVVVLMVCAVSATTVATVGGWTLEQVDTKDGTTLGEALACVFTLLGTFGFGVAAFGLYAWALAAVLDALDARGAA